MKHIEEQDMEQNHLFLAGERVEAGRYRQVGGLREIVIEQTDYLPASLDGTVACYVRVDPLWNHYAQAVVCDPNQEDSKKEAGDSCSWQDTASPKEGHNPLPEHRLRPAA